MKSLLQLAGIIAELRKLIRDAKRNYEIGRANPSLSLAFPIAWQYDRLESIAVGSQVYIGPFCHIVVETKSSFSRVPGSLRIGDRSVIGAFCNLRAAGGAIEIGHNTMLAQGISLIASGHKIEFGSIYRDAPWSEDRTRVRVGNNCWIGAGVTVLPGCCIGDNSVVGAGSVVTKSIPENEVWANIPARRIGSVSK